jgi:hypothetical protein
VAKVIGTKVLPKEPVPPVIKMVEFLSISVSSKGIFKSQNIAFIQVAFRLHFDDFQWNAAGALL